MDQELLITILDIGYKLAIVLVPIIWAIIKVKVGMNEALANQIEHFAEVAVSQTYLEFVRAAKDKNGDKKLSTEEIMQAQEMAWQKFIDITKNYGISEINKVDWPVMIDKAIARLKG